MKRLEIKDLKVYKDFFIVPNSTIEIVFSTAENNRSFNRNIPEGIIELNTLKKDFKVNEVQYLKQVHSDKVLCYFGQENFNDNEGDAIITNKKNVAIGVFTADCVPILLVDDVKNVIAAVHSGWKGTYNSITRNTVVGMIDNYGCNPKDIKVFIGAHIKGCCYEVSEELKTDFSNKKSHLSDVLFKGRNLNMEVCIEDDLLDAGLIQDNMYTLNLCTYCNENIKLHSYRKSIGTYGRMFAFVVIK